MKRHHTLARPPDAAATVVDGEVVHRVASSRSAEPEASPGVRRRQRANLTTRRAARGPERTPTLVAQWSKSRSDRLTSEMQTEEAGTLNLVLRHGRRSVIHGGIGRCSRRGRANSTRAGRYRSIARGMQARRRVVRGDRTHRRRNSAVRSSVLRSSVVESASTVGAASMTTICGQTRPGPGISRGITSRAETVLALGVAAGAVDTGTRRRAVPVKVPGSSAIRIIGTGLGDGRGSEHGKSTQSSCEHFHRSSLPV